jgi:LacI family transcriptional regulator
VRINNVDGAFLATNYLINKRKNQPGYLHSSFYIRNFSERHEGYEKALRYNGMSPTQSVIHKLTPSIEGAYNEMREYLEKGGPIADCYFADNDLIAIGVLRALREAGYLIPKDVAVIGFDDIPLAEQLAPPLTTIRQPRAALGRSGCHTLLSIIDHVPVSRTLLRPSLIVRGSVAAARPRVAKKQENDRDSVERVAPELYRIYAHMPMF